MIQIMVTIETTARGSGVGISVRGAPSHPVQAVLRDRILAGISATAQQAAKELTAQGTAQGYEVAEGPAAEALRETKKNPPVDHSKN